MKRLDATASESDQIPLVEAAVREPSTPTSTGPRRALPRKKSSPILTWLGALLLVFGLGVLGWTGYELFLNPLVDPAESRAAITELREDWESEESESDGFKPIPGKAIALLRIPAFGESFEQPVLVGITDDVLSRGLGWYEGTAKPGEIGNFAVSGHRGSRGPFAPLGTLHPGDKIVVETRDAVYTYSATNEPSQTVVMNSDTWVLDPVPGQPDARPTEALITITTCFDLFHSQRRMILFGTLEDTVTK